MLQTRSDGKAYGLQYEIKMAGIHVSKLVIVHFEIESSIKHEWDRKHVTSEADLSVLQQYIAKNRSYRRSEKR